MCIFLLFLIYVSYKSLDIFLPVLVKGLHWGNSRMSFLEKDNLAQTEDATISFFFGIELS